MPKVHAVNAIMIYADRPAELAKWYWENLGIGTVLSPADSRYYGQLGTWGDGTPVYFGIYPAAVPLGNAPRSVMINYRVEDIGAAISELQSRGIEIEKIVKESYGDFAYLRDPEGNHIELWMEKKLLG
jgi:predicted enzyme related to lactoylglutathione lyase